MSPKIWHDISYVFLASGIIFLVLTIILSIKFQLFSMIKSELGNRKKKEISGAEGYFDFVENKNKSLNNIEEIAESVGTLPKNKKTAPERAAYQSAADEPPATMLISSARRSAPQDDGATVVTSRKTAAEQQKKDDFEILDNIIVIHGNPDVISV